MITNDTSKRLDTHCPVGFTFKRGRLTYELETWHYGLPMFSVAGVIREAHSAALEHDAAVAWEAATLANAARRG